MEKRLLSIKDACEVLSVGRTTIYQLMEAGTLIYFKQGSRRLITRQAIEDFCQQAYESSMAGGIGQEDHE